MEESTKYLVQNSNKDSVILIYGPEYFFDYYLKKFDKNSKNLNIVPVFDEDFVIKIQLAKNLNFTEKNTKKFIFILLLYLILG